MQLPEFKETMLEVFTNRPDVGRMGFLSSFFTVKPQYFTRGELIDIDVINRSVKVAPVVTPNNGSVKVSADVFTGKQVRPPLYSLGRPVAIHDLWRRKPGETVFDKTYAGWVAEMQGALMPAFELEQDMIRLSIEMQAAKMLQTGKVDLTDENGNIAYTLDYGMSASHKIEVTNQWDGANGDPIADIKGAMDVMRKDGHCDATTAIFGAKAWEAFIANENVVKLFQKDVLNIAALNPQLIDNGGEYMGYVMVGAYKLNCFTYSASYEAFENDDRFPFIDDDKVILLPNKDRLDLRLMYANHAVIPGNTIFDDIIPEELTIEGRIRYTQRVIADVPRNVFEAETSSRPLCLPVSIDRIAVLSATVTTGD